MPKSQYVYVNPWSELQYSWQQAIPGGIPFNGLGLDTSDIPTITQKQYDQDLFQAKATMAVLAGAGGALLAWVFLRK